MFLQFPEPVLGRTRSTRKNSVRVTEFSESVSDLHQLCENCKTSAPILSSLKPRGLHHGLKQA